MASNQMQPQKRRKRERAMQWAQSHLFRGRGAHDSSLSLDESIDQVSVPFKTSSTDSLVLVQAADSSMELPQATQARAADPTHLGDTPSHDRDLQDAGFPLRLDMQPPIYARMTRSPIALSPRDISSNTVAEAHNYEATNNIAYAGNAFVGVNHGVIYQTSGDESSWLDTLPERLKISLKADHRYYPGGDEQALLRNGCTPGTRINIIESIILWAIKTSRDSQGIYWLSGNAGAGKTTIAYTISRRLESMVAVGQARAMLGGAFFCSRHSAETRNAATIVRTLAFQLALKSKSFRAALKEYGRFDTVHQGPKAQFEGLLATPWWQSAEARLAGNEPCYVLPIDAPDELDGAGGVEFLSALFDIVASDDLPGLKFFISSRADPALVRQIHSFRNKQICRLEEVPIEESSADIKVFLKRHLGQCATDDQIQQLVADAAGLFIYAATVVEFVKGRALEEQVEILEQIVKLSHSGDQSSNYHPPPAATAMLDDLYFHILETSLVDPRDRNDRDKFDRCLFILHTFLCTTERTSASVAMGLLNATKQDGKGTGNNGLAYGVLHRLHAVLYTKDDQVIWFHKSFPDFMYNARRSQRFSCNERTHHQLLANACFRIMNRELRFNIADISTSYKLDQRNFTLSTAVDAKISPILRYACRCWSAHLLLSPMEPCEALVATLSEFLQLRILFWIEVMNLLKQSGQCEGMLQDARKWASAQCKDVSAIVGDLDDAAAFALYFATHGAAFSTPHLYISSLATFPRRTSDLLRRWRLHFRGIPAFINAQGTASGGILSSTMVGTPVNAVAVSKDGTLVAFGSADTLVRLWNQIGGRTQVLSGHTGAVTSVAFSPDQKRLVSGSHDQSARVWDVSTGLQLKQFQGHTSSVNSVAYSPDGTHFASGSSDNTIKTWNEATGSRASVYLGHTEPVHSVAYSPDGNHVVSCSADRHVRVWDVSTETRQVLILKAHHKAVTSVAYSPDGLRIASGSKDKLVRLWEVSSWRKLMALRGHTGEMTSVAYSPDAAHIISASKDRTVRVWDALSGEQLKVFEGHNRWVNSVAYFPDTKRVVSASTDNTVQIWDESNGNVVKDVQGHDGSVTSVAYSPDGKLVVSGSSDKTLRIWDVRTGKEERVLEGHEGSVSSVAYSPDGTCIVSGSSDKTVRIWDEGTGQQLNIFEGHSGSVDAVAFSLDGTHVISGSYDHSLRAWEVLTGLNLYSRRQRGGPVSSVAISPDGSQVICGLYDSYAQILDSSTGHELKVLRVDDLPENRKGRRDGAAPPQTTPTTPSSSRPSPQIDFSRCIPLHSVAYSRDGARVTAGSNDELVRVWDASNGKVLKVLEGHGGPVTSVTYSPDDTLVVSASADRTLRVWDAVTGAQSKVLSGHNFPVTSLAISPDGTHLVSGSEDKSVRIWSHFVDDSRLRYVRQWSAIGGGHTGWLLSPSGPTLYLMFVPLAENLPDDTNTLTIPSSLVSHVDFSKAKLGDRWTECYTPVSQP